jgi:hypothetical protein
MNTQCGSFQLEKTAPGIFLLQGIMGGALGAFIWLVLVFLYRGIKSTPNENVDSILLYLPLFMFAIGGTYGLIKATIMWGIYHITGMQMPALARVGLTTIGIGLLAVWTNSSSNLTFDWELVTCASVAWISALPSALLIGSRVKPWELFTFGSIAVDGVRARSKSISATLATLPLRFLSLVALWAWVVTFACYWSWNEENMVRIVLVFLIPAIYLFFSLYLTFRSPSRKILLALGLLMNLPVAFLALLMYWSYPGLYWFFGNGPLILSAICCAFLLVWTLFVIARFTAPIVSAVRVINKPEHHCLGSRFLEWYEHAA